MLKIRNYRWKFMREDISTQIFDFSHINDGRSFFAVTADHGGILTFISSVLYKTSILKEVGEYNNKCTVLLFVFVLLVVCNCFWK